MEIQIHYKDKTFPFSAHGAKNQTIQLGIAQDEDNPVFSPMEMVLVSLGSCSSIDVIEILKKQKLNLKDLEVEVKAERADSIPKVFTKVNLHFILTGSVLEDTKVERAINLSLNKYCSVAQMLRPNVEITSTYEIKIIA